MYIQVKQQSSKANFVGTNPKFITSLICLKDKSSNKEVHPCVSRLVILQLYPSSSDGETQGETHESARKTNEDDRIV